MNDKRRHKGDDDDEDTSPFEGIQKNHVLRESRIFSDTNPNVAKCNLVLTRILYLMCQGEEFTGDDASTLFFACTRLFQSQDVHLRRMVYLVLKELKVSEQESIMVISTLNKDMTGKTDLFRSNAIRVLAKIMDKSMVSQIERFFKQAIVDQNPFIVASTLVAGQHLFSTSSDVIKRWTPEVQAALNSTNRMVQFHALSLLYQIKKHDRLAIRKVVGALARGGRKGSLAQCFQIRIIASIIRSEGPSNDLIKLLQDALHDKSFVVMFEAARTICSIENIAVWAISPAIGVLQEFLSSPIPAQRFAAVRTLSQVVHRLPILLIAPCTVDLEHLITDSNRSIATLAITTLLKSGAEHNVDRLLKSISGFMSDISDEFKIVLVDAIKSLCIKFPRKHQVVINFLSSSLREEGGYKFKKAIVDAILAITDACPDAVAAALEHFCEFIEDCEFTELLVQILDALGTRGPASADPAKCIRFIFNRVILETAAVRSAAVGALARIGMQVPTLRESVCVLLSRALNDNDDEVRDRTVFYLELLQGSAEGKIDPRFLEGELPCKYRDLEASLNQYIQENDKQVSFDLKTHMIKATGDDVKKEEEDEKKGPGGLLAVTSDDAKTGYTNKFLEEVNKIEELKELGEVFKTSAPVELTEPESEYVVSCLKHITPNHVIFQFNIINNMSEETVLEEVTVDMEPENDEWVVDFAIPEESIAYEANGYAFVVVERPDDEFSCPPIACTLKFNSIEVDEDGERIGRPIEDEYPLEDLEVRENDMMRPGPNIGLPEFRRQWEELGSDNEDTKKFSFGLDSLQQAVDAVVELLGMTACENSGQVNDDAQTCGVVLTGTFFPKVNVLVRAGFLLDTKNNAVTLKMSVRSSDPEINQLLISAIR